MAVIEAEFANGCIYELYVSTHSMCILKLFDSKDGLSLHQISELTGIAATPLCECLHALACVPGMNVLHKEPCGTPFSETDIFSFNEGFTSKSKKIRIVRTVGLSDKLPNQMNRPKVMDNAASSEALASSAALPKQRFWIKKWRTIARWGWGNAIALSQSFRPDFVVYT